MFIGSKNWWLWATVVAAVALSIGLVETEALGEGRRHRPPCQPGETQTPDMWCVPTNVNRPSPPSKAPPQEATRGRVERPPTKRESNCRVGGHRSAGRCCSNGTEWQSASGKCVTKIVPEPIPSSGRCPGGKERTHATQGHCCWPGQSWSGSGCEGAKTISEDVFAGHIAHNLIQNWKSGQFSKLDTGDFESNLVSQFTPEQQRLAYRRMLVEFGDYRGMSYLTKEKNWGFTRYRFRGNFSKGNQEIRVLVNHRGKVAGFWIRTWQNN